LPPYRERRQLDSELETLVTEDDREPTPTAGFQRVVQRAVLSAEALDREATGAAFSWPCSMSTRAPLYGSWVSRVTHYDAVSFINRQAL
jgi:ATP-dependent Clp protease ATP-binding subunit ClpA